MKNQAYCFWDIDIFANCLTATFHYREDDDDDLINDQFYETFSEQAEEKVYDDLCSVVSSKVDEGLGTGID